MSLQKHYKLELTFLGPLITQAAGTIALGIDVEMHKNSTGQPVINGSLIKGNIRHTLNEFSELLMDDKLSKNISKWFGIESSDMQYTPQRTRIDFDFFWELKSPFEKTQNQRSRIAINSKTGAVKEGALQIVEDCFPLNCEPPVFSGKMTGRFNDEKEQKNFEHWIRKALEYIPAMGGFKGVGWGKLISAELKPERKTTRSSSLSTNSLPENTTRFGIQLELDRPFCLGRPRTPESNQIVSEDFIAGNVIKGLIARLYADNADTLEDKLCFNDLIISHALVADKNSKQRQLPTPLSMAIFDNQVIDMAGLKKPVEQVRWEQAPKFSPDWKESDKKKLAKEMQQKSCRPKRLLVLRTEINKKGISKEGKLFSLECIETKNHIWCADIDLIKIPKEKRLKVFKELQNKLKNGLYGIGKTKAHAEINFKLDAPFKPKTTELSPGRQIITLTTSARILPPDLSLHGTNSAGELKKVYQSYWQKVLSKDVILENYFAQQTITSTYYHQLRHKQTKKAYYPEWLSDAGSVFILHIPDNNIAIKNLQTFAETGLPAHTETDDNKASWKTTPFLPEQGYGEIEINNATQLRLLYQATEEVK